MQFAIVPLLAAALTSQLPPQQYARPVLMSDWDSTWIEPGTRFQRVLGASINRDGEMAIGANLEGASINWLNEQVRFSTAGNGLKVVARQGEEVDFNPLAGKYIDLGFASMGGGAIYHSSRVSATAPFPINASVLVRADNESSTAVLWEGYPVPGTARRVWTIGTASLSAGDGSFFDSYLTDIGLPTQASLWLERNGSASLILKAGDQMPNSPNGTQFVGSLGRAMNPSGEIAFVAHLEGPAVTAVNERAIYSDRDGAMRIVARGGQLAVNGSRHSQLDTVHMNDAGSVVFTSLLTGGDAGPSNNLAAFFDDGTRHLIVREGDRVPGYTEEVRFVDFGTPGINANDESIFYGRFAGDGVESEGIFTWTRSEGVQPRITAIDPVPDLPSGFQFKELRTPILNGRGQIAFLAEACMEDFCTRGVWAQDGEGRFRAIALRDQELLVGPGDWRTATEVDVVTHPFASFSDGNESGETMVFNDSGLLTFSVIFSDQTSGAFVIDTLAVPEPATGAIAVTGVVACLAFSQIVRRFPRR